MRLKVIYEPKGKAREYAPLAANLYTGCSNRCAYCYVPGALRKDRETFHSHVRARDGILDKLESDAKKLAGTDKNVFLCFTCDPYESMVEPRIISEALYILDYYAIPVTILTKRPSMQDLDLLGNKPDWLGITLTGAPPEIEPNSMSEYDRIETLECIKNYRDGISTWISMEPVWDVERCISLIRATYKFTDVYKVGKLNYHPHAKEIDWHSALVRIEGAVKDVGAKYVIKQDLEAYRK